MGSWPAGPPSALKQRTARPAEQMTSGWQVGGWFAQQNRLLGGQLSKRPSALTAHPSTQQAGGWSTGWPATHAITTHCPPAHLKGKRLVAWLVGRLVCWANTRPDRICARRIYPPTVICLTAIPAHAEPAEQSMRCGCAYPAQVICAHPVARFPSVATPWPLASGDKRCPCV